MIITTHQPIFLPWPGFFFKAIKSDCMVLLDDVQFPRGRGWMTRNRIKNDQGELWLTVPVHKKGRGLQIIRRVEIFNEIDWRKKHLRSIQQNYAHAPYLEDYFQPLTEIYHQSHTRLIEFNLELIRFFWETLQIPARLQLQSELNITGKGTDLIINICQKTGADAYLTFPVVEKYLDLPKMQKAGLKLVLSNFHPPVYPQLWGDFIYNLSTLDLLLICGPEKSYQIIQRA